MPSQILSTTENNFTKGLVTEFTGLNFPENAATDTDNCIYTLVGDVTRREGFDLEDNFVLQPISRSGCAINTYKWNNVGGDGLTQMVVQQMGNNIYFYRSSAATVSNPLSSQFMDTHINLASFTASGAIFNQGLECTFADGNGYLFVYHPNCDPFYCAYSTGSITAKIIPLQIRDFIGINETIPINTRPAQLNTEHLYNLSNQGWTQGNPWQADATSMTPNIVNVGNVTFAVAGGITGVVPGQTVNVINDQTILPGSGITVPAGTVVVSGNVVSYSGTSMVVTITNYLSELFLNSLSGSLTITPTNVGFINTFFTDLGNYPSNADIWWYFKDNTDVFNPSTTASNINLNLGQAPQGHFILPAFNQNRSLASSIGNFPTVFTSTRPTNGAWFQGRVWYTGVNAQQPAQGDINYYTWSENIYFSQVVTSPSDFGSCYQVNDPTSENTFDLLATDGGVIQIQGAGSIFKLFPIANGMLVFAANGVWFITGSQGIGFSANDYTITKISSVESISCTSYVDVQGLPFFWNEEGIYAVSPAQGGSLSVDPITVGTILTFYNSIPLSSKKLARGAYHPIDYIVQWLYKPDEAANLTDSYSFEGVLNFNTYNKAFYPYTLDTTQASVNGINYVAGPGGSNSPDPVFKYACTENNFNNVSFAEEKDSNFVDWASYGTPVNFDSFFITGYKVHGQGQRRFQIPYIYVFSRSDDPTAYKIQGIWDYAISGNSGRWSVSQLINNWSPNFGVVFRRHKIRGRGLVLQLKFSSVDGQPFDIIGWSTYEQQNTGV